MKSKFLRSNEPCICGHLRNQHSSYEPGDTFCRPCYHTKGEWRCYHTFQLDNFKYIELLDIFNKNGAVV